MSNERLFHRDFSLMVIGQVISLFGNAVLRFALSLAVLDATGSAAIFGGILAVSMVPTALLSPIGGVLADRLPRQRIMVILDFITAALILLFALFFSNGGNLVAITVLMILLSLIQAIYQPAVQASIPSLAPESQWMAANGIVVQVQALAGLLGPVLGGVLYGFWGLSLILPVCCVCFFLSAMMELFLRIPFSPPPRSSSLLAEGARDLREAVRFLVREKMSLLRLLLIVALLNLFLAALFIIGLPYLVKVHLGLSAELYGFAEAALGIGSILGGLLSGPTAKRFGFRRSHLFLFGTVIFLLPAVLVLAAGAPPLVSYGVLLGSVVFGMGCAALFNIAAQTFLQKQTPSHLLGKMGAFVSTLCMCAMPIGQSMYGLLFEWFSGIPWVVMLFGCVVSMVLVFAARNGLRQAEP